jgi:hypothetical protein
LPPDLPRAKGKERWQERWPRPVVIGGKRAGVWRRTIGRGEALLEADLFAALDRDGRRALEVAVARYRSFLEMPVRFA